MITSPCGLPGHAEGLSRGARAYPTTTIIAAAGVLGEDNVRLAALLAAVATAGVLAFPVAGPAQQLPPAAKRPVAVRPPALPQNETARQQAMREELNQNTVTVISGNPNGAYLYLANDMSAVLDDGNALRVLPVIGKGGYQNMMDVLHLRGVDL